MPPRLPGERHSALLSISTRASALALLLVALAGAPAAAQGLDDGLLIKARELRLGVEYGRDAWSEYWEGTLRRGNGNIGTLTTQNVTASVSYGVTSRLMLLGSLPYVWTAASDGVLSGMRGPQDLTVAAKYRLARASIADRVNATVVAVAGFGVPTSDYTPDFQPLSIGLASKRVFVRAAAHLADRTGYFLDGSLGYTRRSPVTLDRPAYYTNGQLYLNDQVAMPDVRDIQVSAGYQDKTWCIPVGFAQQRTLGGGDIRRQDMPFVSNRMDFTRVQARVMYTLPANPRVIVSTGAMRTLSGRNVGQSTTLVGGVTYVFGR